MCERHEPRAPAGGGFFLVSSEGSEKDDDEEEGSGISPPLNPSRNVNVKLLYFLVRMIISLVSLTFVLQSYVSNFEEGGLRNTAREDRAFDPDL